MTVKDNVNTLNDLTDKNLDRIAALSELHLKVADRVASRQMDAMNVMLEQGVRLMKLTTEAKGYADLYKGQIEIAREMSERLVAESKANLQIATEVRDQYRGWYDAAIAEVRDSKDVVRNAIVA